MKRFLRQVLSWSARLFIVLILLLIVFYAEEDWRGARDGGAYYLPQSIPSNAIQQEADWPWPSP